MDWQTLILLVLIIALLVWSFTRRRRPANDNLGMVVAVIMDIDYDLKIAAERAKNYQSGKTFRTAAWTRNHTKLGFLSSDLNTQMSESFALLDDFNSRIQSAKKSKSFATLQDLPLDKASESLNKSRAGLVDWLRTSDAAKAQEGRRGCLGM